MTKLKQYLQQFGTVAEKDWEFFASRLHQHAFRKKQQHVLRKCILAGYEFYRVAMARRTTG